MGSNRTVRTGVHVTAAPSGCGGCGHPFTLHSNGRTPCKAAGCTGGPSLSCPECSGMLLTDSPCRECSGRGTVPSPCPGFTHRDAVPQVPELLAS